MRGERVTPPLPLLLGEAPSRVGDRYHNFPLSGAIGKRLCEFAGIEPDEKGSKYGRYYWPLREHFDCINAIERYEDAYPWHVEVARERVRRYLEEEGEEGPMVVVALGTKAFDAVAGIRGRGTDWGEWIQVGIMRVVMLPHPSARNLLYNNPKMRDLAGRILREAIEVE